MSKSRAYTVEEMRKMFIDHLQRIANYWATTDLNRPEFKESVEKKGEVLYRMEGMLFSFLVTLDGGSGDMPAFNVSPGPHESDKKFHQDNGDNWWPADKVFNECQLHDIYSARED